MRPEAERSEYRLRRDRFLPNRACCVGDEGLVLEVKMHSLT